MKYSVAIILVSFLVGCAHSGHEAGSAPTPAAAPAASAPADIQPKQSVTVGDEEMKNMMHEMMADCHKKRMSMAKCHENMMKHCEAKMGAEQCKSMQEKMKHHHR